MKPVYEYNDFREFLRDRYAEKKAANSVCTYEYMGSKVGFKSPGYFTQVLKGQTNISLAMAHGFAEFFELNKKESEYFETIVLFNQAQTHNEKKLYYEKLISFKEAPVKVLDADQYEYFSNWHNIAVREVLNIYRFCGNYEELARMVQPAISVEQARAAIALLEKIGLITKDSQGGYALCERHVRTYFAKSPWPGNYLLNSLEVAKKSFDAVPHNERELSSITISTSPGGYEEITKELQAFRNRIREITEKHACANRAYQFNFQVYPISRVVPEDKQPKEQ